MGHHYEMTEKFKNKDESDPKHAKDCNGVFLKPIIHFNDADRPFPFVAVHTQLGSREKLVDKIAKKLLGYSEYTHLQLEFIEPLVGE